MKITRSLLVALALSTVSGCAALSADAPLSQTARTLVIEVRDAPPDPIADVQTASPGPGHIWVAGYHDFIGGRHVWRGGRWVEVKQGFEYNRARYEWTGKTWVFHVPHWKKRVVAQPTSLASSGTKVPAWD